MPNAELHKVGDIVEISDECLERIEQSFKTKNYPSPHSIGASRYLNQHKTVGEVLRTEPNNYSCTVDFGCFVLYLKDSWVTGA